MPYVNIPDSAQVSPIPQVMDQIITTTAVDVNTLTPTTLYTVPTGKVFIPTRIIQRNASTSLTTASLSIGWNSSSYNNVVANATSTGLTGSTLSKPMVLIATGIVVGAAGDSLKVLANTLQGGAATVTFDLHGYLINA